MKKVFLVSFLSILAVISAQAATDTGGDGSQIKINGNPLNPVHTAVPLLSIAPDARGGGMGDIGAATVPDVSSQYWNPAKFPFMKSNGGLGFSYTPWLSKLNVDINLAYLSGYWKFSEGQAVSASLRYFSLGDVQFRQGPNDPGMIVNPNEFSIDAAYSRLLSENWSAAVALRYIRSDLTSGVTVSGDQMYAGNSVAADIAAFYSKPVLIFGNEGSVSFGTNISNIGTKVTYDEGNSSDFLPTNWRLGGSFNIPFDDYNKLSINADINKFLVPTLPQRKNGEEEDDYEKRVQEYNNGISVISGIFRSFTDAPRGFKEEMEEIMWSAGLEYSYINQFFVRGGYFHESQNKGNRKYFTAGVGFRLNIFQLDAAYVIATSQSNPLDQTLRFSLSFDLAGIKNLMGRN